MRKILVTTISFVNTVKPGSEIYTTFAKRLVDDVLNKTPWDIRVSTNRGDLFSDKEKLERVSINSQKLENHKTHVGAFNQLLKFFAIKDIDSKYDYVLYLDCDAGFTSSVVVEDVERMIDYWESKDYDMVALRTNLTYDECVETWKQTRDTEELPKPIFNNKLIFYGENDKWLGAKLPSEHIFLAKNSKKLTKMAVNFEEFCTKFETQDEIYPVTYDMESFEIGISAHLAGYNMGEMGWGNQCETFKVGFNANNWEKVKI